MQAELTQTEPPAGKAILIMLLMAVIFSFAVMAISHADLKHASPAAAVHECLGRKGALQIWQNPTTGRLALLCEIADATFGIQIIERAGDQWREVTAFIKNKMTNLQQVTQYLRNTGYLPLE